MFDVLSYFGAIPFPSAEDIQEAMGGEAAAEEISASECALSVATARLTSVDVNSIELEMLEEGILLIDRPEGL